MRHFKSKESRYRYPVLFNALFAMSYKTIVTLIDNDHTHACFLVGGASRGVLIPSKKK